MLQVGMAGNRPPERHYRPSPDLPKTIHGSTMELRISSADHLKLGTSNAFLSFYPHFIEIVENTTGFIVVT